MSAYKQFLASDVIITPFEVNRLVTCYGDNFGPAVYDKGKYTLNVYEGGSGGSPCNIDRLLGKNLSSSLFDPSTDPTTGNYNNQYQRLIYQSLKELYYSNFTSQSNGNAVFTASLVPGNDVEGNRLVGSTDSTGRYENYLQTSLTASRIFPTGSDDELLVISIPKSLYGDYIQPTSFNYEIRGFNFTDDGNGNIKYGNRKVGDIIYTHGVVVFFSGSGFSGPPPGQYGEVTYGQNIAEYGPALSLNDLYTETNVTCSFSSSLTIYETQYKTTIRENEFNFSLNPSLISGSTDGTIYDFATGSYFSPYVTTVGLYDEQQNLLAVGKLSQPLPTSRTTDTSIFINIDR